ncbi:MAG: hypothetical protein JF615_13605 [Asticcacaulis sp.]|nr:hypothetical protein [Asticcacaulis sp.]
MDASGEQPTPPAKKGFPCLIAALIVLGLIAIGVVLFPIAIYVYAYVLNKTTG